MNNNNNVKLNAAALGLALGMVFGLGVFCTGLFSIFGLGVHFATSVSTMLGFNISNFHGLVLMSISAFVIAYIHGILIAYFYNYVAMKNTK